jgi:F-type H+-transporting ATPase subunit epsilon
MALQVLITTPDGLVHRGEATKVILPLHDGELGVLPHHAPLVGMLGAGELRVTPTSATAAVLSFFVEGGFLQVLRDKVTVLATRAEPAKSLVLSAAEEDLGRLLAEAVPPGSGQDACALRMERIRTARVRAKLAGKSRGA